MIQKLLIPGLLFLAGCQAGAGEVDNNKDLNQNMMDLRLYQENLGDYIRKGNFDNASWLLEGMDSIMLILGDRFPQHRRLAAPFSYYYKKEMQAPVRGLREALREKDKDKALRHYRLLVDNCNDCHIDNEVEKEVHF